MRVKGVAMPRRVGFITKMGEPGQSAYELADVMLRSPQIQEYLAMAKTAKTTQKFVGLIPGVGTPLRRIHHQS